jgi:hypothetical protein
VRAALTTGENRADYAALTISDPEVFFFWARA